MDTVGLGFFTHFQLERLLGGGNAAQQQRRRLIARGLLPEPKWLRVDRTRLAIFPEFSLATLTATTANQSVAAAGEISHRASVLYASEAFEGLKEALETALRVDASAARRSTLLGAHLIESGSSALETWRDAVRELLHELVLGQGLRMDVEPVRVSEVHDATYIVRSLHAADDIVVSVLAAADQLEVGAWATLHRVGLLDAQREFLLGVPEQLAIREDDALATSLAAFMADGPAQLPLEADEDRWPAVTMRRRPPERAAWRGANTMTRLGSGR